MKNRIEQARTTVKDFTSVIEKMRDTRDRKLSEIQTFGKQIEVGMRSLFIFFKVIIFSLFNDDAGISDT